MINLETELDYICNRIRQYYDKALRSPYVQKPLAWAVYQVWRHYDAKEEAKNEKRNFLNYVLKSRKSKSPSSVGQNGSAGDIPSFRICITFRTAGRETLSRRHGSSHKESRRVFPTFVSRSPVGSFMDSILS